MRIASGATRVVILIGKYAIKIPKFWRWKIFLRGLLANIDENYWYKHSRDKSKLCPVLLYFPTGFFMIMKRAEPLTKKEYNFVTLAKEFKTLLTRLDNKMENFGKLDNKIVLVDYADSPYMCSDCSTLFKCHYDEK